MLLVLLLLLGPFAFGQKIVSARAGMVYYAEGELRVDGKLLRSSGVGRLPQLQDGQSVSSPRGHAEVLLGPYAILWTGTGAQVRFEDTRVEEAAVTVVEGAAMLELTRSLEASRIRVRAGALEVELTREGVYRFDAAAGSVRVYAGEIALSGALRVIRGEERAAGITKFFDRKELDEFHYWSAYRSFMLEGDAGAYKQWGGGTWGERVHSGFGVKFPDTPGAARAKYQAASEAGLVYQLEGSAVTGAQARTPSTRLPMRLGTENFLRTDSARAEVFLGVGVVARFGENTRLRMVDTRAASPVAALDEGAALIEVANSAEGSVRIRVGDSETELLKPGLYYFDAKAGTLRLFGGEAATALGGTTMRARDAQQVNLRESAPLVRFDTKARDALYKWSAERSFALFLSPAAFMTQWEPMAKRGWFKHKQFGERLDTRPRARPRPLR
jgi:hypothetical protein